MLDINTVPHAGKPTSNTPFPGQRLRVRVEVRPGLRMKQLPDGRNYPEGVHELQVYKGDLPALECLVETREDLMAQAAQRHAAKLQAWIDATRKKDAKGNAFGPEGANREGNYTGGSVQTEFRQLTIGTPGSPPDGLGRGMRPLLSCEVIGEPLESFEAEKHREEVRMIRDLQTQGQPAGLTEDQIQARIDVAVERALARLTAPTQKSKS